MSRGDATPVPMRVKLELAAPEDAEALAELRTAVAEHLTTAQGRGHWSSAVTAKGVLNSMRRGSVLVARRRGRVMATLGLTTRKPWAIDPSYFTPAMRPLYLVDMAVAPDLQGKGIGRGCLLAAEGVARLWPAQAIRLDAYDHAAGAGGFYARCGYREVGRAVYRKVPLIYYELVMRGGE